MNRRKMLAALGLLSGGGAVVSGTGAFTSASADRDVAVQVATDATGYLAIDDTGNANAEYVTENNGSSNSEFGLDFTSGNSTTGGGGGVNADAITVFADLFEVRNQGTQDVDVQVTPLSFIESSGGNTTLIVLVVPQSGFPNVTVSPGNAETYDVLVTATDDATTSTSLSETITVSGEAP
ncbi:hypothetical protein GCM10008995_07020 [Halobellus salinus]|uniref:DUF1102 domain-containing protein n=1 Tax=Halobellus salinus TaxID=931585 RepID=A0A830ECX6_9EURY|nr:hypothetical protein [Halobellus salinus]GGI99767.1 hypothetical protein GCM10008995_07020 [Halobellus salinus]SMP02568.1 hypothetical protein SAMN06265347_101207 [Halobellus salinus]